MILASPLHPHPIALSCHFPVITSKPKGLYIFTPPGDPHVPTWNSWRMLVTCETFTFQKVMLLTNLYTVESNFACRLFRPVSSFAKRGRRALVTFDVPSLRRLVFGAVFKALELFMQTPNQSQRCCSHSSDKFPQSAKASRTWTIEKQLPLHSTHRTTQQKRSQTLSAQKNPSEIKQREALHSIIWRGCYLVTDTVQYLQILTPIKYDQEGDLAPSLPGHPAFFSFPRCSQEQHWLDLGSLPCFPCCGAPWSKHHVQGSLMAL